MEPPVSQLGGMGERCALCYVCVTLPATCEHIGEQLSTQFAEENKSNRKMLIKILSCFQLLARQGLAIRGDGDECHANFIQLFKFLGQDDVTINEWLKKKMDKYTSHDIQNELLKIMSHYVLRGIAEQLQSSSFLTVMIDETTDVTNQEQVTIIFRMVDNDLSILRKSLLGCTVWMTLHLLF